MRKGDWGVTRSKINYLMFWTQTLLAALHTPHYYIHVYYSGHERDLNKSTGKGWYYCLYIVAQIVFGCNTKNSPEQPIQASHRQNQS